MTTIPAKFSKKEWKKLANELGREVGGLQAQVDALRIQVEQYQATLKVARQELAHYKEQYEAMKKEAYKAADNALEVGKVLDRTENDRINILDQRIRLEDELEQANERLEKLRAWKRGLEEIQAESPGGDIQGWYWDIVKHRPVLVNGVSEFGLKGVAIQSKDQLGIGIKQIPGAFLFDHLVRIDTNIELQY